MGRLEKARPGGKGPGKFVISLNNPTGARPQGCFSVSVLTHITLKRVLVALAPPGGLPSASHF